MGILCCWCIISGSLSKRKWAFHLPPEREAIAARIGSAREEVRSVIDLDSLGVPHAIAERIFEHDAVA